jgi:hypothetical protein
MSGADRRGHSCLAAAGGQVERRPFFSWVVLQYERRPFFVFVRVALQYRLIPPFGGPLGDLVIRGSRESRGGGRAP